jgi:hypothetical protein
MVRVRVGVRDDNEKLHRIDLGKRERSFYAVRVRVRVGVRVRVWVRVRVSVGVYSFNSNTNP